MGLWNLLERAAARDPGKIAVVEGDLRRTYAALMVAAGAHPMYLQAQMGTRPSA